LQHEDISTCDLWTCREKLRIEYGVYDDVSFDGNIPISVVAELRGKRCVHKSINNPTSLAFTPDNKYGWADRQITMRVGKLLRRITDEGALELTSDQIRDYATSICATLETPELQFALTEDDIRRVYCDGPMSCMHPDRDYLRTPRSSHPAAVYATDDLAVAYIADSKGNITARCVVNMINNEYVQPYGDTTRIKEALKSHGFMYGDLEGCRVKKIKHNGMYLMPYIDGDCRISDEGDKDFFVLSEGGDMCGDSTTGYLEDNSEAEDTLVCAACEERHHEDEFTQDRYGDPICEGCIFDYSWVHGRYELELYYNGDLSTDDGVYEFAGEYYTEDYINNSGDYCIVNDEIVLIEDCVVDYFTDELILTERSISFNIEGDDDTFYTDDVSNLTEPEHTICEVA